MVSGGIEVEGVMTSDCRTKGLLEVAPWEWRIKNCYDYERRVIVRLWKPIVYL